jgi:hypothetical protein
MTTEQALTDRSKLITVKGQTEFTASRHSCRPEVFLFFAHTHFLKQFYADTHLAHLLLPQPHKPPKHKAKSKKPNFAIALLNRYEH